VQGFTNAIARGQQWVYNNPPELIAEVIAPFFPDADPVILASAISRYKEIEAYASTPIVSETAFERLQRVMDSAGELPAQAPFYLLVDNTFAVKADDLFISP